MIGVPAKPPPFVGLNAYTVEQAGYFFGRDTEARLLESNLRSARFTLLYGPSGVGKTSLISAGLVANLDKAWKENLRRRGKPGFLPVLFRSWQDDPAAAIAESIRRHSAALLPPWADAASPLPGSDLQACLRAWSASRLGDLLLILDQFELFFVYATAAESHPFVETLARCVADHELSVNYLISIREDWLPSLDVFKGRIPNLFQNYLRLRKLDRAAATAAIERPIQRFNELHGASVQIEPGLVAAVLARSVETPRSAPAPSRGVRALFGRRPRRPVAVPLARPGVAFEAPALQLIMLRLWIEETANERPVLRSSTLERLTQRLDIIDQYVADVMRRLLPRERSQAAILMDRLVTPSGTKIAQTLENLAVYIGRGKEKVGPVITKLAPLLTDVAPPQGVKDRCFEISHDVLAPALARWQNGYHQRVKLRRLGLVTVLIAAIAGSAISFGLLFLKQKVALQYEQARRADLEAKVAALGQSIVETTTAPPALIKASGEGARESHLGVLSRSNLWTPGATLRVRFLDGSPKVRKRVQLVASEWTRHANLNFDFGDHGEAEVRVSFEEEGSWGYLGKDALAIPADQPTVNFGYVDAATPDREVSRYVLHEFGHVLGLIHEISQPNADIPWNQAKVLETFSGPPNFWSREQIDENFFLRYRQGDFPEKPFDPQSIMMFPVPKDLTDGRLEVGLPQVLSAGDKEFIALLYPGRREPPRGPAAE